MRVLVTGAGGFAGGHIARLLAGAGYDVVAATRSAEVAPPVGGAAARRFSTMRLALDDGLVLPDGLGAIVHAAATSAWAGITVDRMVADNVVTMRALVREACRVRVEKLVFLSSISAYGTITASVLREGESAVAPDAYGTTKLIGEQLLADAGDRMASLAIRLPAVVGAGSARNWPSETLRKLRGGEPVAFVNPASRFNNAVHVADLAALVARALERPSVGHDLVLAASAGDMAVGDVVALLARLTGSTSRITSGTAARPTFLVDTAKARRLFGWEPLPIAEAIRRMVRDGEGS